jgi:cob(I)alamin adenosyltransferase
MMTSNNLGQVQVFWGDGKGKTTAALGCALRACGSGLSVHLIQFMKNGAKNLKEQMPGEIKALSKFKNFSYKRFGLGEWYVKDKNYVSHRKKIQEALSYLKSCFGKYDIIIADEILYAVQLELLDEQEVVFLIKEKPGSQELILTGSHKPFENIFAAADLVTEVKKHKHPFDRGITARKGFEY